MRRTSLVVLLLLATPVAARAQLNLPREGRSGFALEWVRPYLEDADNPMNNMVVFGSGHVQLGPTLKLLVEVPLATAKANEFDAGGAIFGNPYIGLQSRRTSSTIDVGVRVPALTVDRFANIVGVGADLDRIDAFASDAFMIHFAAAAHKRPEKGITYGARMAPTFWIPTRASEVTETEVTLGYTANVGVASEITRLNLGLTGLAWISETGLSFSDRTVNQVVLAGDFGNGNIRPGFFVAKQLDSDAAADVSLGLTLQVIVSRPLATVASKQ